MSQRGTHTWDLVIEYIRCPECGFIIENREKYQYRLGKYQKDLECPRCHHRFTITKNVKPKFGPLIGEAQPVEMDWEEHST
jgi:uncharacterized C2H2 Zn-finger protein